MAIAEVLQAGAVPTEAGLCNGQSPELGSHPASPPQSRRLNLIIPHAPLAWLSLGLDSLGANCPYFNPNLHAPAPGSESEVRSEMLKFSHLGHGRLPPSPSTRPFPSQYPSLTSQRGARGLRLIANHFSGPPTV